MIDITGVDPVKFVKTVYALSKPQGLGLLHYQPGELSDEDARRCIVGEGDDARISMDYVRGRACKMTAWHENGRLVIRDKWFDHTDEQLHALLDAVGLDGVALLAQRKAA